MCARFLAHKYWWSLIHVWTWSGKLWHHREFPCTCHAQRIFQEIFPKLPCASKMTRKKFTSAEVAQIIADSGDRGSSNEESSSEFAFSLDWDTLDTSGSDELRCRKKTRRSVSRRPSLGTEARVRRPRMRGEGLEGEGSEWEAQEEKAQVDLFEEVQSWHQTCLQVQTRTKVFWSILLQSLVLQRVRSARG